ncbi:hypothetical protein LZZ90_08295 [Flavobacterium sp. SM15]|uniref:hypothetical protein n=1 Tax=Flavobacterium sp. SM15 TaxID=2908005 RepID=UPI001EDC8820|nr:hypothetical protein [Flavobacterium sp. SM15]MCG2611506.1 hypothetical protein [Flavobacterium sp. SM15]
MRIKLIDVDNRLSIKYNQTDGIHNWGDDNAYPSLVKSIIGSSVTAKQCVDINSKYIYGKGFEFAKDNAPIVSKKGLNINQLLRITSREFSEQNNIFLHVNYNALFEVISVDLLPSTDVRIGKTDSKNYAGKYVVYNNWDKSKSKKTNKDDYTLIDRFNSNQSVIEAQVEAAGGWSKYKGQILHLTADFSDLYSLSDIDCVILDADSQYQSSVFKNGGLRKGFFGAKLFITKPFDDDNERDDFVKTIEDLKGAEDSSGVLHLEAENETDVLSEQLIIQNIDSNIDDKKFEYTDKSNKEVIIDAFDVHAILVNKSDNSIFGNSGELLKEAKLTQWEKKEEERNIICEAFKLIFNKFHQPINPTKNWNIIPIIQIENTQSIDPVQAKRLEAQAQLKGSVGGVQALLQIQQSVSQGLTDLESGIVIISEIFGIESSLARQMLGNPKITQEPIQPTNE